MEIRFFIDILLLVVHFSMAGGLPKHSGCISTGAVRYLIVNCERVGCCENLQRLATSMDDMFEQIC